MTIFYEKEMQSYTLILVKILQNKEVNPIKSIQGKFYVVLKRFIYYEQFITRIIQGKKFMKQNKVKIFT